MSRPTVPARRRSLVLIGLLGAALVALTGCGVGQVTETAQINAAIDGADGNAGNMAVRNARIAYPDGGVAQAGGRATLLVTLANTAVGAQKLVSVSSPAATSTALASTVASADSASPSTSTSPGGGTSPSPSPSASPAGTSGISLTIPGQGLVVLSASGESIVLLDLTRSLVSGRTVPVTFAFSNGESVTLTVPIAVPDSYQGDPTATPTAGLGEPANR